MMAGLLQAQAQTAGKVPPHGEAAGAAAQAALKASPRHGEWVEIAMPGSETKIRSFVVYPERKEKAGVVIVIFEIFGLTDWVRGVTDQLAADGFIAIAPDLLSGIGGGSQVLGEQGARGAIGQVNADEQVKRLDAVREYALKIPAANGKIGTIGFCWGGAASFNYAARQPKLNAAVIYYGSPVSNELMAKVECPVMGFYGQNDARITSTVDATKKTMDELKKSFTSHVYDGAGHGFLRQQSGMNGANQKASDQAWPATIAFFKKNLE